MKCLPLKVNGAGEASPSRVSSLVMTHGQLRRYYTPRHIRELSSLDRGKSNKILSSTYFHWTPQYYQYGTRRNPNHADRAAT